MPRCIIVSGALLLSTVLVWAGCPPQRPRPPVTEEDTPPVPRVDQAFLTKVFGPGFTLAQPPVIADLDSRPGTEALLVVDNGGKSFQLAVVRGNQEVLSRAPLAGKILASANITHVGAIHEVDLLSEVGKSYLLPIETLVYHRSVCGILAVRYRNDALSVVGEFSCKCWRKEAGGGGTDPYANLEIKRQGNEVEIEAMGEGNELRTYRWQPSASAFVSQVSKSK